MSLSVRRAWPLIAGLVIVILFGLLEARPAPVVRSSFTLVGIIDCGLRSDRSCPASQYITLISDDSGSKQPYKIDLSWIRNKLPGTLSQDQQVRIEIERLPDGTLMALRIIELDNRNGVIRDDENALRPKDAEEDDETVTTQGDEVTTTTTFATICVPATTTQTSSLTTTRTSSATTTATATSTLTTTTTSTTTDFGPAAIIDTVTLTSTTTLFPCGTTTLATSTTVTEDTTTTTTETTTVLTTTTSTAVTTTTDFGS